MGESFKKQMEKFFSSSGLSAIAAKRRKMPGHQSPEISGSPRSAEIILSGGSGFFFRATRLS